MKKQNFYSDNKDISFHLEKRLDFDKIFDFVSPEEKEIFSAEGSSDYQKNCIDILESFGAVCSDKIAESAREVDETGLSFKDNEVIFPPVLKENIELLKSFGMTSLSIHPRFGGMGGPFFLEMAGCEILNRACPSTMLNCAWHAPIARVLMSYASPELVDRYMSSLVSGDISGNMALTEAGAGSDLGAIKTFAKKSTEDDNLYLLTGEKKFITNGTAFLSLVLAKGVNDKTGLSCLSLYLCPREFDNKKNFSVTNLEKKVALNGSATCELVYERSKAYLLGKDGEGYRYMLTLMNDSRIGVGFQALGLLEGIYQDTKAYANERSTWGKPIVKHELIAEKLLDQRANLTALRSLAYKVAYYRSLIHYIEDKFRFETLGEDEINKLEKQKNDLIQKLRYYTPLFKYKTSEEAVRAAREGVQILGGYGFTKDYSAEWHMRESLIYPIYEGTSQMQALMSMKDTIKQAIKDPKDIVGDLFTRTYLSLLEKTEASRKFQKMIQLERKAVVRILTRLVSVNIKSKLSENSSTDWLKVIQHLSQSLSDFSVLSPALLNAERLCEIKSLIACSRALLDDLAYDKKREAITNRYINTSYLKVKSLYMEICYQEPILANFLSGETYSSSNNPLI